MGGPGSGRYPREDPQLWIDWCQTIPDSPSIRKALERIGKTFWDLGTARHRWPEVEEAYKAASRALGTRLVDDALADLDPSQLLTLPDPKLASATASLARERATMRRWHAEKLGGDYAAQIAHTHDVSVTAVVMLPPLAPLTPPPGTLGTGASATARLASGSDVTRDDSVQAVDATHVTIDDA